MHRNCCAKLASTWNELRNNRASTRHGNCVVRGDACIKPRRARLGLLASAGNLNEKARLYAIPPTDRPITREFEAHGFAEKESIHPRQNANVGGATLLKTESPKLLREGG